MRSRRFAVIAAGVVAVINFAPEAATEGARTAQTPAARIVASIPVGSDGVTYAVQPSGEELWGPASLRLDARGNFLVTDTAGRRVLRIDAQGGLREAVPVANARTVSDVAVIGTTMYVLDAASEAVVAIGGDGAAGQRIEVPQALQGNVSGLRVAGGGLVFELSGGAATSTLSGVVSASKDLNGVTQGMLGGAAVLGVTDTGDFFVLVTEVSDTHVIHVDQTVRKYGADGHLIAMARVPIAERYTYVANGVAVAPDGAVYALVPRVDRVDIVRLAFSNELSSILPGPDGAVGVNRADDRAGSAVACRTRDDMYSAALEYINNRTFLSTTNIAGACAGRTRPRYLTTAGTYTSVPYDWGGYVTVGEFNTLISQGRQAGDIDSAAVESCSVGVDCSGFVSRVWGTSHNTTSTLPGISTAITTSQLQRGDILNKAGDHVAMIDAIVSGGVKTLEATTYQANDRVINITTDWSRFAGYSAYRYNGVCATAVAAAILTPAPGSTLSSSSATFTWDRGTLMEEYFLYVGTSFAANDLYGQSLGTNLSASVTGLPTDGRTLYVRLWSRTGSTWLARDYTYTAWRAPIACTSFSISPQSASPDAGAGSTTISLTGAPSGCAGGNWTAFDDATWVSVSPTAGTGSGQVTVSWTQNVSTSSRSATATIAGRAFSITQAGAQQRPINDVLRATDFDGDGRSDLTIYNAPSGMWFTLTSTSGYRAAERTNWGGSTYAPLAGDFDGDGKIDRAVYHASTGWWYVLLSNANFTTSRTLNVGGPGWTPVPGDYDGDGRTDAVVYNPSSGQWYGLLSRSNYTTTVNVWLGGAGYTPVPADFDGDGRTDVAVYASATGMWTVRLSSSNFVSGISKAVGGTGYVPVPADFDGDGKADFTVYRSSTGLWYGLKSSANYTTTLNVSWGGAGYAPVKGDFDGDGRADLGVYHQASGGWYILLSGANYTTALARGWGGIDYAAVPQFP